MAAFLKSAHQPQLRSQRTGEESRVKSSLQPFQEKQLRNPEPRRAGDPNPWGFPCERWFNGPQCRGRIILISQITRAPVRRGRAQGTNWGVQAAVPHPHVPLLLLLPWSDIPDNPAVVCVRK